MKLTKELLIKIIKEEYAAVTGVHHGGEKMEEQVHDGPSEQDYIVNDWIAAYVKVYGEEPDQVEIDLAYKTDPYKIEQETVDLEMEYENQMNEQSDDWRDYGPQATAEEEETVVEQSDDWRDYKLSKEDELISIISDTYKDIYGFRPKGMNLDKKSVEELEAIADDLFDQYEEQGAQYDDYDLVNQYYDDKDHPWDPSPEEAEFDAERAQADEDDMYDDIDFDKHGGKVRGSQIRYTSEG